MSEPERKELTEPDKRHLAQVDELLAERRRQAAAGLEWLAGSERRTEIAVVGEALGWLYAGLREGAYGDDTFSPEELKQIEACCGLFDGKVPEWIQEAAAPIVQNARQYACEELENLLGVMALDVGALPELKAFDARPKTS